MDITEINEFLNSFTKSGAPVRDLSRITELLERLGNPQSELSFIHIAGTNGKGSTAEMFYRAFLSAGVFAGLFTSPYIFDYTDRISFMGKPISNRELSYLCDEVKTAVDGMENKADISQFEITMAIALLYYKQVGAEIVVLETGVGGALDCTNVITSPVLCVITSISHDHVGVLGSSISEIAKQKAGIIKSGSMVIIAADNPDEVKEIAISRAEELGCKVVVPNLGLLSDVSTSDSGESFSYNYQRYRTAMPGRHQIINALNVIEGMGLIRNYFNLTDENVADGIRRASLPGRIEVLSRNPLVLLDGCHNDGAVAALCEFLKEQKVRPVAVVGMLKEKNASLALKPLMGAAKRFVTVDGFHKDAYSKEELCDILRAAGVTADVGDSLEAEYKKAVSGVYGDTVLAGSLYLVSTVKKF